MHDETNKISSHNNGLVQFHIKKIKDYDVVKLQKEYEIQKVLL
jgi:hypothetical protein